MNLRGLKTNLLNKRGSVLVNVLAITALITLISSGIFVTLSKSQQRYKTARDYSFTISLMSEQILSIIENDTAWYRTIVGNPSMACLLGNGNTCSNVAQEFDLLLPDDVIYLSPTGTTGFDRNGFKCNAYSAVSPDFKCVYKVKLAWRCGEADCLTAITSPDLFARKPKILISMRFFYNSSVDGVASEMSIDSSDLVFVRGEKTGGIKAFCESVSGKLVAGGLHCRLNPVTSVNCRTDAGRHMVDRVENGVVKCKNPIGFGDGTNPFLCDPGSAITGFVDDHPWCDVF